MPRELIEPHKGDKRYVRRSSGKFTKSQDSVAEAPPLARIVVAIDPPASAGMSADACGLVAAGRAENGTIYAIA